MLLVAERLSMFKIATHLVFILSLPPTFCFLWLFVGGGGYSREDRSSRIRWACPLAQDLFKLVCASLRRGIRTSRFSQAVLNRYLIRAVLFRLHMARLSLPTPSSGHSSAARQNPSSSGSTPSYPLYYSRPTRSSRASNSSSIRRC